MPKRITPQTRAKLATALNRARETQTEYWAALGTLEELLGVAVDQTRDLMDCDVETLLKDGEKP